MASARYTFGDGAVAGGRLAIVARVFAPTTGQFLRRCAPAAPELAVDLGCGPGHTTELVSTTTGAARTVGLERSDDFVAMATARVRTRSIGFVQHDVTQAPFPAPTAELLFCRFLLTHLPAPAEVLATWRSQLAPGGLLLVEEVEAIHRDPGPLDDYLDIVAELLEHHGQSLYVGPVLHALADPPGLERVASEVASLEPAIDDVVAMFRPNLATWRIDPVIRERHLPAVLDALDNALASAGPTSIRWELRQLVYRRLDA